MRRYLIVLVAAILGAGGAAHTQTRPRSEVNADWLRKPTEAELQAAYPTSAKETSGEARLTCTVSAAGVLGNCRVVSETPRDLGFGAAALNLISKFQMRPARRDGVAVESEVTIPVIFSKPNPGVYTNPDWLRKPTLDNLRQAFPIDAKATSGRAAINCIVSLQGLLRDCTVASEDPPGQGFGSAALAMAPQFLMRPATKNGVPFESHVTIPVTFDCGGSCKGSNAAGRRIISGLIWAAAPTQEQMVAGYPSKAKAQHILGVATIECQITDAGGLKACETMSEDPKSQGFGRAAADLAKHFQRPTNVPAGVKVAGQLTRLTFTFGEQMFSGAPYVAKPKFAAVPTATELMDAYRAAAPGKELVSGSAVVRCRVVEEGALTGCALVTEQPTGAGVGAAVLAVAPKFRIVTWTDDGLPVIGTSVRLPISFNIKDPPVAEPPVKAPEGN